MSDGGAEALKAAIRRSLFLIVLLVLLGIVFVNTFRQLGGPSYAASTRVLISPTLLPEIITNPAPSFVDPARVLADAEVLASSPEVYRRAAEDTHNRFGSRSELKAATSVSASSTSDILTFSATSSRAQRAVGISKATARAYVERRADFAATTAKRLRALLKALPPDAAERSDIENLLTKLAGVGSQGGATIVAPASSAAKVSPAPAKDTILGASIGLVVALLMVGLREALDTTVRSESDIEEILAAPVLATVRSLPRRARIVTYGRYGAFFGDSYALLAANLARIRPEYTRVVVAVTSAVAGEGKTTTAANLAVSLGRRGSRVVLVDFDLRNPALGKLFRLPRDAQGVLQVLLGKASIDDSLWSVTLDGARPEVSLNGQRPIRDISRMTNGTETTSGSLLVLPAGGVARAPSAAFMQRVAPVLEQLRVRADFVILDTPPAFLTVELSELSGLIDNVLVVVRHGRVSQRSLRLLSRQARTWPAAVAGAVLTDAPGLDKEYAYYGAPPSRR